MSSRNTISLMGGHIRMRIRRSDMHYQIDNALLVKKLCELKAQEHCPPDKRINWPLLRGMLIAFLLSLGIARFIWAGIKFAVRMGLL